MTAAATMATSAARRYPETGEPRPMSLFWRIATIQMAIAYAVSPAETIVVNDLGSSARLTNLSRARRVVLLGTIIVVAAIAAIITTGSDVVIVPAALACYLAAGIVVTTAGSVRAGWRVPAEGTHLLSDLTRHPTGAAGAGVALVDDLADLGILIIGTTTGRRLWDRVYQGRAEAVGHGPNERTYFRILPART